MAKAAKNAISPTRAEDYPEWYQQVVRGADRAAFHLKSASESPAFLSNVCSVPTFKSRLPWTGTVRIMGLPGRP